MWAPAALLVASALALPGSAAADEPPLRLRLFGGTAFLAIPPSSLEPDVARTRTVTVRSDADTHTDAAGGVSVKKFLTSIGISPDAVTTLGVKIQPSSTTADDFTISGDEVRNGFSGDPVCPACEATLDTGYNANQVFFFRPLRSATDRNLQDWARPAIGRTLGITVESSAPRINMNLTAEPMNPKVGQPVTLRATFPGGETPSLTWYFGDGTMAKGDAANPAVTHAYGAGGWTAGVFATDGTGYGASSLRLSVGDPASNDQPAPTAAPSKGSGGPSTSNGAGGSGGGSGTSKGTGGKDAPADGARDPDSPGDKPSRSTKGSATPAPTAAPAAATQTPAGTPPATPTPLASPSPTPQAAPATPEPSSGTRVEGQLVGAKRENADRLAGALAAADALAREQPGPSSSIERSGEAGGRSFVESAASGMLLIGLLGAGALSEVRRIRRATLLPR